MKNIVILEDDVTAKDKLVSYLERYSKEKGEEFSIKWYDNPLIFLNEFNTKYDIAFFDIELPNIDGMEVANKIRQLDENLTLIFVTNMAQYAIKGYEVSAFDFMVKPVAYPHFVLKLQRALRHVSSKEDYRIKINVNNEVVLLTLSQIRYIEVVSHEIIYHTEKKNYSCYGTLKKIEEELKDKNFARCNYCYLVNLKYVTNIKGYSAFIGKEEIQISHSKKNSFVKALNDYLGGKS